MPLAARLGDRISHTNATAGLITGALAGAAIGALCVATGGVGAVALAAAGGAGLGGVIGALAGTFSTSDAGSIVGASTDTSADHKGAARATDPVSCSGHGDQKIAEGSATVLIDKLPAARLGDRITCGAIISSASGDVDIGGPTKAALPMGAIPPPPPPAPLGIDKLLGADTAALVAKSPSLTADMKALEAAGWKVQVGPAGGGTFADRPSKTITVDKNQVGQPQQLTQSLSHEVGHARYNPAIDTSSKPAYMRSTLADEGAATLSNVRAEREIVGNGGPDIGVAGNPANQPAYNAAYDQYLKDGDGVKARDSIGTIFGSGEHTSTTGQTYSDYYGGWYDKNVPNH